MIKRVKWFFIRGAVVSFFLMFNVVKADQSSSGQIKSVAILNGETITQEELRGGAEKAIFDAELKVYELYFAQLKAKLIPKFIQLDARSQNITDSEFIFKHIVKTQPITKQDIEQFIQSRRIAQEKINDDLKEKVRTYMENQQVTTQLERWFWQQVKKHNVEINLIKPQEPRYNVSTKGAPYIGNENAPVTIVEFSDFECPYCASANKTLAQLREKYADKIKIVYKHFPLSFHPNAQQAAEASMCAFAQSNEYFWQLHDAMFASQRNLSLGVIKDKAKSLELDYQAFNKCLDSDQYLSVVEHDISEGESTGVSSTPAFYINGRLIKGAQPIDVFVKKIEEELVNQ